MSLWSITFDKGDRSIKWSKNRLFNNWCWVKLEWTMKKKETRTPLTPYSRIKSKLIKDLNINHDTIKVLEENIGRKMSDIPCCNVFTNMSPRARDIKERINKWDYIKLKSFFMAKENVIKMEREPTVWENLFANNTSDKSFIPQIYEDLTQLNARKTNNPI